MKAINVLLSVLVSVSLFALAFEGGLRLLGLGPPDTLQRFDAAVGWTKKPNHEVRRRGDAFDVRIATNELGLRDDPMTGPAKPPGLAKRVLVLGDSFTLGYTVNREDLFTDLLEGRWRAEGRSVDVVNAGTEAWSTDQEVRWLVEHGAEFQPDLVVLASYDNDLFWNGQSSYTGWPKPLYRADGSLETTEPFEDATTGWRRRTAIGRLLTGKSVNPTFKPGDRMLPADFASLMTTPPPVLGDALARSRGALIKLKRQCDEIGAQLLVAPIPSNASVDSEFARRFGEEFLRVDSSAWDPSRPVDLVLSWCAEPELRIAATDAREALRKATLEEPCYFSFFDKDREWHFNARGNHVFAEHLYDEIERLGLLPPKQSEAPFARIAEQEPSGVPTWMLVYGALLVALTGLYYVHYKDEPVWQPPLKVGALLAVIFAIFHLAFWLRDALPPQYQRPLVVVVILSILSFVGWKLGRRIATIGELLRAFVLRGHWYLMPLVVILLTVGSLLVVAASSPFVAPFIYTLF